MKRFKNFDKQNANNMKIVDLSFFTKTTNDCSMI